MGIFSLFGKKERQPADTPDEKAAARKKRETSGSGSGAQQRPAAPRPERSTTVQRKAARATAMKIDAIESEMSSEFVKPLSAGTGNTLPEPPAPPTTEAPAQQATAKSAQAKRGGDNGPMTFQPTLPAMGSTTELLLGESVTGTVAISTSQAAPVIEEAAILYANDQKDMVEHVLQAGIHDESLGAAAITVWRMLFDFYQLVGNQAEFDKISIEYASKFETSPPAWVESAGQQKAAKPSGATPAIAFGGVLDGSIAKLLDRLQTFSERSNVLRLEFARVTAVDPVGCGLLVNVLTKLQRSGHDLILVGAADLATKIRAIIETGRRDETDAPWLLLMEILRLLNLESEFEETSIDYCVTFEVSPPAFVPPKNKVTTAIDEIANPSDSDPGFKMPAVIEGNTDVLIQQLAAYAEQHQPTIVDCSGLKRVDFSAAGHLVAGLAPISARGARMEFHEVNHLVAALFAAMGMQDIVTVSLRKS